MSPSWLSDSFYNIHTNDLSNYNTWPESMDTMQTEERNTVPRNNVMGVDKEAPEETEHEDIAQWSRAIQCR